MKEWTGQENWQLPEDDGMLFSLRDFALGAFLAVFAVSIAQGVTGDGSWWAAGLGSALAAVAVWIGGKS